MTTDIEPTLVEFIRYNNWANQQLLAVCVQLSDEQTLQPIPGGYGPIRHTFGHMLAAEADFMSRITGTAPQPPFQWEEGPTLAQMADYAVQLGAAWLDVINRVPSTQIVREEGSTWSLEYTARQLFMQTVNHGIEHRTNITLYLNSLGLEVPEIDNWGYMWAHRDRFAVKESQTGGAS